MAQINELSLLSTVAGGDQLPVYSAQNGDTRRMSISALIDYLYTAFTAPTTTTIVSVPLAGNVIPLSIPVTSQVWLLLQPAGALATLTVTLPLASSTPDGTEVVMTTTQGITALTTQPNGATAVNGMTSGALAGTNSFARIRFVTSQNSWYRIG